MMMMSGIMKSKMHMRHPSLFREQFGAPQTAIQSSSSQNNNVPESAQKQSRFTPSVVSPPSQRRDEDQFSLPLTDSEIMDREETAKPSTAR